MNYMVFGIEGLPFSLVDNIYITTFQCWLLMGGVAFGVWLIIYRKFSYAVVAAGCMILFTALQWNHFLNMSKHSQLTIYSVSGQSAWDIIDHGRSYFFADSAFTKDTERIRFHIRPNRLQRGVREVLPGDQQVFVRELPGGKLIRWKETTILQIFDRNFSFPDSLAVDYVVIGKNALWKSASLATVKYRTLILDSSNSYYFTERILKEIQDNSVHSVLHEGAFIAKL
jgi:competence protein ComEC